MKSPSIFPKSYPDTLADAAHGSTCYVDHDRSSRGVAFLVLDEGHPSWGISCARLSDGTVFRFAKSVPVRVVELNADTSDANW